MNAASRYGIMAAYDSPESFLAALRTVRAAGFEDVEVFVPYAVEGMTDLLPGRPTPIGWIMAVAGVIGASSAYFMQWYAVHDFVINVGGRPVHSWPSFVPITFELMVLTAALTGLGALLWLTRLPCLHHPVFHDRRFYRASQDRFFLCIRTAAPESDSAAAVLRQSGAESIEEVPA